MNSLLALIPARLGSKRIKNKNIRILGGHPLLAYTINIARKSELFKRIIVSTDSERIAEIAIHYGAEVPFLRPEAISGDISPDIDWIKYTLEKSGIIAKDYPYFFILRPTSPFRTGNMLASAWEKIKNDARADSLRAVEKCSQHPAKMWFIKNNRLQPVFKNPIQDKVEWHSIPYQALPEVYSQNASLEIAKTKIPLTSGSISGKYIIPFVTGGFEGYDINTEKDWIYAEYLIKAGIVILPEIAKKQFNL